GKGETILLQGIIDCAFREGESWVLIDYKSDRLKPGEDAKEHAIKHGYGQQLDVYSKALTRMTGLDVKEGWIFFTSRSAAVNIF
ncbi:MAG: PD-(D/E)XK nuclease family protein, partial [Clostridia bacterium]|nr:PD-(D/E)XK nuclease family protein [Clostridia bacterium]